MPVIESATEPMVGNSDAPTSRPKAPMVLVSKSSFEAAVAKTIP
jgi:hypothetical protein